MQQQKQYRVLLIGETCEDIYMYGDIQRLNPEAPVPVVKYSHTETFSGMSSNVKKNLESFGIFVNHITNKEKIKKTRVIHKDSGYHLIRIDEDVEVTPIRAAEVRSAFLHYNYDAIVVSDYNKGFITTDDLKVLCKSFDGPVFIDTKKRDLFTEKNAIFKINGREFNNLTSKPDDKNLIVTLGDEGACYMGMVYQAQKVNVFDVVGAGDTFLAALVYAYFNEPDPENKIITAVQYANVASSIAVQHQGTYTLTKEDIEGIYL